MQAPPKDKEQVNALLNSGEGCRLVGHLEVNKVSGNFHIAPGISFQQNHMVLLELKFFSLKISFLYGLIFLSIFMMLNKFH